MASNPFYDVLPCPLCLSPAVLPVPAKDGNPSRVVCMDCACIAPRASWQNRKKVNDDD